MTPVIFKLEDGSVVAFFPQEPGTYSPYTCACYAHIGQHSSADVQYAAALPHARPEQYTDLQRELVAIGYDDLAPRRRFTHHDLAARKAKLKRS